MDKVTIVIPVKDEEVGLQFLIEDFERSKISQTYAIKFIFVIDERTSDDSKKIASKLSDIIIDQSGSTGKADAVRKAMGRLKSGNQDFVVFLDADGSYSFNDVKAILSELEKGVDVSSGSRFLGNDGKPEGMSRLHTFGNHFLSKVSSLRNRRKITDLCTGLWGFSNESIEKLDIKSSGFDLEAEIAGLVRKNHLSHSEVPVSWSQRKGGESKLRSLKDGFVILMRILRT